MDKPRTVDSKFYVQSINRALAIVAEVSKEYERGLSANEIAERIDLHISTVYRICQNLVGWQYLTEQENGNYVLGLTLLTYGNLVKERLTLANIARKYMSDLNQQTRETVLLAILDKMNGDIMYIDKIDSLRNIKLTCTVGSHNYIHSTANGKCLVSELSDKKIQELLSAKGMPPLTSHTITDLPAFLAAVRTVREAGYAIDDLENDLGVRCIAAPIHDYTGQVVAAISVSGIEANMDLDKLKNVYIDLITGTAGQISTKLGYNPT